MKARLTETFVQPHDLKSLKGAGHEDKKQCLENAWIRFRLLTGWQANRAALKALRRTEAYALVLDQQDSLLRFGILSAEAVRAARSFPASDRPGAIPIPDEPLGETILAVREAGKIPIVLHYWANPRDCASDDDLLVLTYESMPGTGSA